MHDHGIHVSMAAGSGGVTMEKLGYVYAAGTIIFSILALAVWLHDRKRDRHDHKAHG